MSPRVPDTGRASDPAALTDGPFMSAAIIEAERAAAAGEVQVLRYRSSPK